MKIVFVGANKVSKVLVNRFVEAGHDVIIIDRNKEKINELSEFLDCGFIHGDGTKPDILKEVDPKKTDILICGTQDDHANIISTLLAKSLEFPKVITMIANIQLEMVCQSLGLPHVIYAAKTIGDYLEELSYGRDVFEVSCALKNELHLFPFIATEKEEGPCEKLSLPNGARVVWIFRNEEFILADESTKIEKEDEIVIAAHRDQMGKLKELFTVK